MPYIRRARGGATRRVWTRPLTRRPFFRGQRPFIRRPAVTRSSPAEIKVYDFVPDTPGALLAIASVAGADDDMSTGMSLLNSLSQGAGASNRIGSKVVIKSLQLDLSFDAIVAKPTIARYMLIYDKAPNGAYPTIGTILADNSNAPTFVSGVNMANRHRFEVIRDRYVVLDGIQSRQVTVKEFCKGWWPAMYKDEDESAAITDILSGAIYLIYFAQAPDIAGAVPLSTRCRLRFID